jgi:hypothetical protein
LIHPDTKELSWSETSEETHALVEEMQDVLRLEQLRGIAGKHLRLAYERGRSSVESHPYDQ